MGLHRLTAITIGVPDPDATADYYRDFGLADLGGHRFGTVDGGEQLRLARTPQRRLLELGIGVHDRDDLARIASRLDKLTITHKLDQDRLTVEDPNSSLTVVVEVAAEISEEPAAAAATNGPGRLDRIDARADGIGRTAPVRPRKLGHVVIGSLDQEASQRFFAEGLGFKISDRVPGLAAFMRCSTDHHNVLVQQAPLNFLHHTAWEVDDVDEVGRGATAMLEADPERHVWGLGRHHIGSNFFWYLKDPAGNFSEYYSDLDCIVDDALWKPEVVEGAKGLYNWGPPPPPSFLAPEDLAALMTGSHSPE
ncbi:glyoxalase/bleomycin resistance protein/dioxygenase superfamily protein [Nocardia nova SH22a]|uniref:Glyoxalase/bleomycin resistance protein/dioxygenase superfamily protein n=1 Tax=Nocardia nova SH22a TaxID=1415166 RepID=W5TH89_9NOCA|nr:VOC family protein [Nocardia nova]AHH18572.1 glyoxalase/bleomycin resistance protein/dioxygenase superfamily protein [Nocardia nova SH22a]